MLYVDLYVEKEKTT